MIPRLTILTALLILSTQAIPSSPPPSSEEHCECRCCTRKHFRTECAQPPFIFPLAEGYGCDTRLPIYHNPNVCGPALCNTHFGDQCKPPAFMQHACVSDRGPFQDWAPLAFVFLALILSAYVASMFAARVPSHRIKTGYQRPDTTEPQPANDICQPLVSSSSLAASYGVEVLDHSPRQVITMPVSPPIRSLSDPHYANTYPLHSSTTPSPLQDVVIPTQRPSPFKPTLPPTQESNEYYVAPGDSEGEDET